MSKLQEYIAKRDAMLKNGKDPFHCNELTVMREELENELVVRKNINLLQRSDGRQAHPETHVGWYNIIGDCLDRIAADWNAMEFKDYRIHFLQIKEKFGGLRMYYKIFHKDSADEENESIPEAIYKAVREQVKIAEITASKTCENCGAEGHLVNCGGWVSTLCDDHVRLNKSLRHD